MRQKRVVATEEREALREALTRAYTALGSWDAVGKRVLGKSGTYAWRIVYQNLNPSDAAVYHWREFYCKLPALLWDTTPELMAQAWEIISECWGPDNAIPVPQLAHLLNIHPRRARATRRALCKQGYPVCSARHKGGGYFRPRSLEEYREWRKRALLGTGLDLLETVGAQEAHELEWFPPVKSSTVQLPLPGAEDVRESVPTTAIRERSEEAALALGS